MSKYQQQTPDGDPTPDGPHFNQVVAASPGDVVAVRSGWDAIATGEIGEINDKPAEAFAVGDWVAIIEKPEMWDVSAALDGHEPDRHITIDHGEPMLHDGDEWDGPGLSIAAGNGGLVLRQPEPVYRCGVLRHYKPLMAGRVEEIAVGAVVDPTQFLRDGETFPERGSE